ncbi:protein PAT1 homolog 1 isoform X2 [Mobula hypostoma]|uniref:protein PAT1 homolog 1 isoform X2 n=2 Tax=Mobula TaxID=86365 RepID=UPI002FC3476D
MSRAERGPGGECLEEEEDDEALQEEDHDIDQFNEDTFGSGAVEDWEEQADGLGEEGGRDPGDDLLGASDLAESISRLVVDSELEDPAVMGAVPSNTAQRVPQLHPSMWEGPAMFRGMGSSFFSHLEGSRILSGSKDSVLPRRPAVGAGPERDLSDRAPPPRSSSPVIGSPPVRTAPIGTPPKQHAVLPLGQQPSILCPTPIHVRAPIHQRFSAPFVDRRSPTQLLNVMAGRMSPSLPGRGPSLPGATLSALQAGLLPGRGGVLIQPPAGFRPFFTGAAAGRLQELRSTQPIARADTTHLHPQHRRLLTQRFQTQGARGLHRGQGGPGGDRLGRGCYPEPRDPYSNLMSQREKDWVSKIQMMQLQSADPSLDDYYYQNYFERLERQQTEGDVGGEAPRKERTRLITPQLARLEHTYRPVQFEGSLGKLTVSSVNNPRKMIDAVVTTRGDDDETKEKQVRDRRRQTLHTIEKTYSLLLEVKDLERKFVQVSESERPSLLELRKLKIDQIYENLRGRQTCASTRLSDEHFVQIMCIRKGKRLTARALGLLGTEEAASLLQATARNLPLLAKKDSQDEILPSLTEPCTRLIGRLPSGALTELLRQLTEGPGSHFAAVLQNKFGVTLFYMILSQGERLQSSAADSQLMEDNRWTELVFAVTRELLKMPQACLATPSVTPGNLLALFSHYVDRQRLGLLEAKLQLSVNPR